jgi:hypothetical protein
VRNASALLIGCDDQVRQACLASRCLQMGDFITNLRRRPVRDITPVHDDTADKTTGDQRFDLFQSVIADDEMPAEHRDVSVAGGLNR